MIAVSRKSVWILLVALILVFGMLLRLYNINKESFWADEGWTMVLSKGPTLPDVVQTMANDQHPPLYFVLMHYWIDLVGNSETMTRLLSTFWSIFGIAVIFRLGADLFSPEAGVLAALMLALVDNDIMLAQEARHYTQMAALAAFSTLFYFRYLRHQSRTNGIAWFLASVALMYTHYLGGFILIVQVLHMLIFVRPLRRLGDMLFRWVAICLAWLPWAFVFINQSLVRYTRPDLFQSALPNGPDAFSLVRSDLIGSHFGLTGGLALIGLVYIAYLNGKSRLSLRPARPTVYMALWLFVPIISIVVINIRYPILTTRNFLLVTPVIALLIGHGFMNLDRTARILLLLALVFVDLITVDAYMLKPPWRQVAQDILQYRMNDEPVLMDIWVEDFALSYHIGRDLHTDPTLLPVISMRQWRDKYHDNFFAYLLQYISDKPAFWLAYWGKDQDNLLEFLTEHGFTRTATQIELHRQEQLFVYRYDRVSERTLGTFGGLFALGNAQLAASELNPSDTLRVDLLWRALKPTPLDYSVSVFVLGPQGNLVAQHDSPPLNGHSLTSTWTVGTSYFDGHALPLPTNVAPGTYTVGVKVYWYADPKPLPVVAAAGAAPTDYLVIGQFKVGGN